MGRWAALSIIGLSVALGAPPLSQQTVIRQYCAGCHNEKTKTAGLTLDPAGNISEHPEKWEKVVRKLRARYMPPAGMPRPDERTYESLVSWLESVLDRTAAEKPNPGRTDTFRRLNRTEYRNAVRDLLALDVDVSSLLPADESSHGFDNVTVGNLSPTLMERYLSAARKISRLAIGSPSRSPGGVTINLPADLTQEEHFDELPLGTRGGATISHTFPVDAEYEFQLRLARDRNEHVEGLSEPHEVELTLDGRRLRLFTVEPPSPGRDHSAVDKDLTLRIAVSAGPHQIGIAFPKKPSLLLETERQPYQAHFNMDRHPRIQPAIYSISINGPYGVQKVTDTPSRRRIFVCSPAGPAAEEGCARQILATLTRRAYRRAVNDADIEVPLKFYSDARTEGGFEAGIEMALRAVLVSPQFLFRIEQDPRGLAPDTTYRISSVELASRLSFFLWSSGPDDGLLDLAIADKLREPAVLEQQAAITILPRRARER
jgi:hypothetical protein